MPAEQAYPGDDFVNYIGVDVYDSSSTHYSHNAGTAEQHRASWQYLLNGDHGLTWWSDFARAHHKALAVPEWGVSQLPNGQGGGDDPAFVDEIFHFMTDPNNNVAYEHYFNGGSGQGTHNLTAATNFPQSAARLRANLQRVGRAKRGG
jgi:hypothetical protein